MEEEVSVLLPKRFKWNCNSPPGTSSSKRCRAYSSYEDDVKKEGIEE
jgi:hypothetical protein